MSLLTEDDLLKNSKFKLRTLEEAENLAEFMALHCHESKRILPGLKALLVNAIEHGNLAICKSHKNVLGNHKNWRREISRLLQLPHNQEKFVSATLSLTKRGVYIIIEDQGEGFDWEKFIHIDPARAGDHYGRGIALAHAMSFDKLVYNDKGNRAVAFVSNERQLEW